MRGFAKKAAQLTALCFGGFASGADDRAGGWSGNYLPCDRHEEVLKQSSKNLGVRFSISNRDLRAEFVRALNFWATILDMDWYEEDSRNCSIAIFEGDHELFRSAEVARAQFPESSAFQGWIAVNRKVVLRGIEPYMTAVHELGHLLGLRHNPSPRSVMFFLHLDGPVWLDIADLAVLAARHKLRALNSDKPLLVTRPMNDLIRPRFRDISRATPQLHIPLPVAPQGRPWSAPLSPLNCCWSASIP
jgi:hypothetical protein